MQLMRSISWHEFLGCARKPKPIANFIDNFMNPVVEFLMLSHCHTRNTNSKLQEVCANLY